MRTTLCFLAALHTRRHFTSGKKRPAQYSLYRYHGRGDEETEEDIVKGKRGRKKQSKRSNKSRSRNGFDSLARAKRDKGMQVRCQAGLLSVGLSGIPY